MALVQQVFNSLAGPEREVMLLAEGAHCVDRLAPAFLFLLAQNRLLPGDGFEDAFYNFFARTAEAAGEGGFNASSP